MTPLDIVLIVGAFVLILFGAEVFTDGVEWLGIKLNMTEGATGSILAAFGTATPETLIPVVAIVFTNTPDADQIGVGAILGAPFMLGTLVMLLIGVTAYVLRGRRGRDTLHVDAPHATRDLSFFLVMYTLALALALLPAPLHFLKGYLGWIFLPSYGLYLYLVLRTPRKTAEDVEEQKEEREAFGDLTFAKYLQRFGSKIVPTSPPMWLVLTQVLVSFGAILLGAMVFQSTIPVTLGVLLTPWQLGNFGTVAAVFALISGAIIWIQLRTRTKDNALPLSALMLGGSLYVIFLAYVLWSVLAA